MPPVILNVLAAAAMLALFLAGLFVPGRLGGALLAVSALVLIGLTSLTWSHVRRQGRPLRLIVIAAVSAGAIVKLIVG